jgi:hypothetical protein
MLASLALPLCGSGACVLGGVLVLGGVVVLPVLIGILRGPLCVFWQILVGSWCARGALLAPRVAGADWVHVVLSAWGAASSSPRLCIQKPMWRGVLAGVTQRLHKQGHLHIL